MLRFTIRDLLWLSLVSSLIVAAWLDRRYLAGDNARLRDELRANEQLTTMLFSAFNRVDAKVGSNKFYFEVEPTTAVGQQTR